MSAVAAHFPPCDTLVIAQLQGVLHVTLNRPASRNAMSLQMVEELGQVLTAAHANTALRAIVMRGAQGNFCSGADLRDMAMARMAAMGAQGSAHNVHSASELDAVALANLKFGELCIQFRDSPLAFVTVLEGSVMGGGLGLACVADVAIADAGAVFRLPETSLGLVPAQIAPFLVERMGYSQAKRFAVTGGRLSAQQALASGLVHEVHTSPMLDAAIEKVLADIRMCAPGAVAVTKSLVASARYSEAATLLRQTALLFSQAVHGQEGQEGTLAFMQKRKPLWTSP